MSGQQAASSLNGARRASQRATSTLPLHIFPGNGSHLLVASVPPKYQARSPGIKQAS